LGRDETAALSSETSLGSDFLAVESAPVVAGYFAAGLKTRGHVGGGADPRTIEECAKRGYDLSAFRCRQIAPSDFADFDLILAMDRSNFDALQGMRPTETRARIDLFVPGGEVPDPYFGGPDGFVVAIDIIESRCQSLLGEIERQSSAR
jgi:protein-tyrosine phosphatase